MCFLSRIKTYCESIFRRRYHSHKYPESSDFFAILTSVIKGSKVSRQSPCETCLSRDDRRRSPASCYPEAVNSCEFPTFFYQGYDAMKPQNFGIQASLTVMHKGSFQSKRCSSSVDQSTGISSLDVYLSLIFGNVNCPSDATSVPYNLTIQKNKI